MRIKVGDGLTKLKKFRDKLANAPKLIEAIADNAAEAVNDLVAQCFADQANPYGEPWPDKVFDDGRAVLVGNTTRLRRSWHVVKIGKGKRRIAPNVNYASYHQRGTGIYGPHHHVIVPKTAKALAFYAAGYVTQSAASRVFSQGGMKAVRKMKGSTVVFRSVKGVPPRKMVPEKGRGLPAHWKAEIQASANEVIAKHFKK